MKVDPQVFWSRAGAICDMFADHQNDPASSLFEKQSLVIWTEKNPEIDGSDEDYALTSRLSLFLTNGYEFPETLFAFTPHTVCVSASDKKLKSFQDCKSAQPAAFKKYTLEFVPKVKDDPLACAKQISSLLPAVGESTGFLHNPKSEFAQQLQQLLGTFTPSKLAVEECLLWTRRDDSALQATRDACEKLCQVNERFRKSIPDFEDEPRSHETEVKRVEKLLTSEKDDIEPLPQFCNVQSGNVFDFALLRSTTTATAKDNVTADVICLKLGAVQHSFAACVMRTVFVDPKPVVKDAYTTLLAVRDVLVAELKPGSVVADVHSKALAAAGVLPVDSLSFGFAVGTGIGLHPELAISSTNQLKIREGMVFCLDIKLPLMQDDEGKAFACEIGDTVLVVSHAAAAAANNEILTAAAKVDWKRSHFRYQAEDDEQEPKRPQSTGSQEEEYTGPAARRTRAQEKADLAQSKASKEQEMGKRQWDRLMRKRDLGLRKNLSAGAGDAGDAGLQAGKLVNTYKSPKDLPTSESTKRDRIHIDNKHECVLLPLGDRMIPFHISTIKSVTKVADTNDQESASIRFNFHFPSATSTASQFKDLPPEMAAALETYPQLAYIKELTFKSRDVQTVQKLVQTVRDLAKRTKERNKKDFDESNLVQQAALQVLKERSKEKPATLIDVSMYPSFTGRATVGRLRAHINGFRFAAEKLGEVDILYDNIKYFFFMRGDRELKVCVHCYLKNAIMIGKKKTKHVQFYTEVQEGSSDLQGRGGGGYDPDEIEDEERQRRLVSKLNKTFAQFCQQSIEIAQQHQYELELEVVNTEKTRSMGFLGMPAKEMVLIQPTTHCLVNLSEKEPFVLAVDEIEHIHLQRLSIGKIRNFDIVFILKAQLALDRSGDNLKVVKIENVPIEKLDSIRDWIDSHDELTYTCGEAALKWETVLDGVRWELDQGFFWLDKDKEGNKKDYGWMFLNPQGLDDESSEDDGDDSSFGSSEDSSDEESEETDDSDVESEVDEDSDDDVVEENSSDEGEDWEDLERKAEAQDRNNARHNRDEEEEARRRPKKKSKHY